MGQYIELKYVSETMEEYMDYGVAHGGEND